jgi:hypothetical protein
MKNVKSLASFREKSPDTQHSPRHYPATIMTRLTWILSLLVLALPATSFPNPALSFAPENVLDLPKFGGGFDDCVTPAINRCGNDDDRCKKGKVNECINVSVHSVTFRL